MKGTYFKRLKLSVLVCLILLSNLFLSGCWSSTEVDNLAIINVLGIDVNQKGDYELTANVVKPQELYKNSANGGGNDAGYRPIIETGKGKSIVDAMGHLSERISNRIYLGHVLIVVLGERVARNNLEDAVDFLTRENHFRPNIKLLVAKGEAKSILHVRPRVETTMGAELESFLRNTKYHPNGNVLDVSKFVEASMSQASDPYTAVVNLESEDSQGKKKATKKLDAESDNQKLVFSGTGVFNKNGLMGFLNERETEGLLWINGNVLNDIVVLNCANGDTGTISIKISHSESDMNPRLVNGKPVIDETIKLNGDIRQLTCRKTHLSSNQLDDLNKKLKKKVLSDIDSVFQKAKRDWETDIFGFGEAIYKKYPKEWEKISPRWTQGELRNLKVNFHFHANISNYGLVRESD
jgi:spore germination protein KC